MELHERSHLYDIFISKVLGDNYETVSRMKKLILVSRCSL